MILNQLGNIACHITPKISGCKTLLAGQLEADCVPNDTSHYFWDLPFFLKLFLELYHLRPLAIE